MMNLQNSEIFIVVPSYNEGTVLAETLKPLAASHYSVVVVDDGSRDETRKILKGLPVTCLRHAVNLGQGAALQTGMSYALNHGAKVIVHFDADGQHEFEAVPEMVRAVVEGKADVVLGSRFLRWQDAKAIPVTKRIVLKTAVLVNAFLTGLWLTDAHNGLRVLSRHAAEKIRLQENGFAHASEICIQIRRQGLKVIEWPTFVRYTDYSKQKGQSVWNAFNIVIDILLRGVFK